VIRRGGRIHRVGQHEPSSLLQAKVLLILKGVMLVSVLKWWCSPEGLMFASWAISFIENGLSKFSFSQMTDFVTPLALPSDCPFAQVVRLARHATSGKESLGAIGVRVQQCTTRCSRNECTNYFAASGYVST
jgi:hypothetical protein